MIKAWRNRTHEPEAASSLSVRAPPKFDLSINLKPPQCLSRSFRKESNREFGGENRKVIAQNREVYSFPQATPLPRKL